MKWGTSYNVFLKSWSKYKDIVVFSRSWKVLAKWMIARAFSRNGALSATSFSKVHENAKTLYFAPNVASFGQINGFSCFLTNWATFCNLLMKGSSEDQNMVVCSKKDHTFGQIHEFSCFLTKWRTFWTFLLKSSWKCQDMVVWVRVRVNPNSSPNPNPNP